MFRPVTDILHKQILIYFILLYPSVFCLIEEAQMFKSSATGQLVTMSSFDLVLTNLHINLVLQSNIFTKVSVDFNLRKLD
jgi:hypothetical protein